MNITNKLLLFMTLAISTVIMPYSQSRHNSGGNRNNSQRSYSGYNRSRSSQGYRNNRNYNNGYRNNRYYNDGHSHRGYNDGYGYGGYGDDGLALGLLTGTAIAATAAAANKD